MLWISNQSFSDESVQLVATIDGDTVVDAEFEVKGQHNWVSFPLHLAPGDRELVITSDTDVRMEQQLTVPEADAENPTSYAVVSYWNDDDATGPRVSITATDQPPAFA